MRFQKEKPPMRLFLSAFAVSLFLLSIGAFAQSDSVRDFLGLEEEVLPDLNGPQRFTTERLHESNEWRVTRQEVEIDKEPLKGQNFSIIPWKDQSPENLLDIQIWMIERERKDLDPDWKIRVRDRRHTEIVGKVLTCRGSCKIFRGVHPSQASYRSKIHEGDEFHIGEDSYAWIYLMDGSLVRLSSGTSVTFQEINVGREKFFVHLRLNHGHLFWNPKNTEVLKTETSPETDGGSLPLMLLEANQQNFERIRFQGQTDWDRLIEASHLDEAAIKDQFKKINELRTAHQKYKDFKTQVFVVSPNLSVDATHTSFDFISLLGGKSYLKKRETRENEEMSLHLRGYLNTDNVSVTAQNWIEISENGRENKELSDPPGHLQVTELITKRIKTMELARELWFRDFTAPMIDATSDDKKLGLEHGYVLWEKGIKERFAFLTEYTRRIETTNLRSIENLLKRMDNPLRPDAILSEKHYQASLNHYLKGLKTRYTEKKMQVREMNDLQYYVWALRHGKFQN